MTKAWAWLKAFPTAHFSARGLSFICLGLLWAITLFHGVWVRLVFWALFIGLMAWNIKLDREAR